jgi:ArsR family transcriptional regulator
MELKVELKTKLETTSKRLAELGNLTRLSIFTYLVKVGPEGAPVGQIQKEIGIPGSTLSHHINRLVSVGLIRQIRESRVLYCVPQFKALEEVTEFLLSECCSGGRCNNSGCE